ncbi:MAG TPA: hypothetical protein VFF78_01880, partial [Anaerolineaceae bacterium]|nr:hypothetical protein [Anaerolineaceae bacterium]
IFTQLKLLLQAYQPPFTPKRDEKGYYDLWSFKTLEIDGRKRKEVFFAGIILHKDYVGFHFMPVYGDPEMKSVFQPELLKLLQGKSCFHIKKLDDTLLAQIRSVLEIGFQAYQEHGWV